MNAESIALLEKAEYFELVKSTGGYVRCLIDYGGPAVGQASGHMSLDDVIRLADKDAADEKGAVKG